MATDDPGYGPPPGRPNGPARGGGTPFDELSRKFMSGLEVPNVRDPAFDRPIDATDSNTKARAKLIYRDIPLVTIQNTWSVDQARGAIYAHLIGLFYASGLLCDSILGDDRVTSTMNSRAAAVFGRETRFKAANESRAAKECLEAWQEWWPRLSGDSAIRELFDYGTMMGFSHGQLVWDRDQPNLEYAPSIRPWHPVFTWYDWQNRVYQAIGQDGMIPIVPGNGKWMEYTPFGSYRGWMRGAIRPCVEPWMLRHFGFRDMARFGEVHGNPTRVGKVPMVGDPILRGDFETAIKNLGADTALIVPTGVDQKDGQGYSYELVEAQGQAWEVHPCQIDRCDMAIVLAILMVNLTTQVEGGSFAAAKVQMDVRSQGAQLDNNAWKRTLYNQLARPFAFLNFGDANLAPWTWFDVTGPEEYKLNSEQFKNFMAGMKSGRDAGIQFKEPEEVRQYATERFGLAGLPAFDLVPPVGRINQVAPDIDPDKPFKQEPTNAGGEDDAGDGQEGHNA